MARPFRLPEDPKRAGQDVDREIDLHLELKARELEAGGMGAAEARIAARAAFGDRSAVARECRDVRTETLKTRRRREWLGDFRDDLRVALRGLGRAPGFTLIALLTLAIGIGANAAIFTVLRSVLLAPLPYPEPDRLVQLWTDERSRGRDEPEWLTWGDLLDWRAENQTLVDLSAYGGWNPDLTGDGEPESLGGLAVSASYFSVLRVKPALGRDFLPSDDHSGAERVVILSDGLWRRRYGADPAIIGRALTLNGDPWVVIGVMGPEVRAPLASQPDLYRPQRPAPDTRCRSCYILRSIGRMKPGVAIAQVQQDLGTIAARLARTYPESNDGRGAWVIGLHQQLTGASRAALLALTAAVGLVLLIACVNLANLLLVRGAARARELAVRAAIGAGRHRLLRQLLTESLVLAVIGGTLGLGIAAASQGILASLVPTGIRTVQPIGLDLLVVAFTAVVSMAAALLFGLVPALRAAATDLMATLRAASRSGTHSDGRLRGALVVTEIALSVVLLVGAALLLQSFVRMQRVDLGFRTEGLVTLDLVFPRARYQEISRAAAATDDLLSRLRSHPAIRAAEVTDQPPLNNGDQDITALPVGEPPPPPNVNSSLWYRAVSPGYGSLIGLRIVKGRAFQEGDRAGAERVAIVNEAAVTRFWSGKDPVGRLLAVSEDPAEPRYTVVGVVANARPDGPLAPAKPELFIPIGQTPSRGVTVVIDPAVTEAAAIDAFRATLKQVDPLIPISGTGSLVRRAARAVAAPRTYALFVTGFAAVALVLAGLGVYGVMAFTVTQKQRDIGVRLALGASPPAIRRMVLGQGVRLTALGAGIGIVVAALVAQLIRSMLFGVGALDPITFLAVPLLLGGFALLATWIPAQRATRVAPLIALREE
jgi:putative ABC transport system permease protein